MGKQGGKIIGKKKEGKIAGKKNQSGGREGKAAISRFYHGRKGGSPLGTSPALILFSFTQIPSQEREKLRVGGGKEM